MAKSRNKIIAYLMILMILLLSVSSMFGLSYALPAASLDKTSILTDVLTKVSQNGAEISSTGTLTSEDPISVEISFGVPVKGDDPTPADFVEQGDTASFALSTSFDVISTDSIPLNMGDIVVGHVKFETDSVTHMLYAKVDFDGDIGVFNGDSHTVTCKFNTNYIKDNLNHDAFTIQF